MVVVRWCLRRCPGEGRAVTEVCLHCMATPLAGHALPQHTVCPPPLRFYLREMVMVNKQALRLASLSRSCQGAGPSSRRGTTTLTPKETGVCVRETLLGQCVLPLQSAPDQCGTTGLGSSTWGSLCGGLLPPPLSSPFLPSHPLPQCPTQVTSSAGSSLS